MSQFTVEEINTICNLKDTKTHLEISKIVGRSRMSITKFFMKINKSNNLDDFRHTSIKKQMLSNVYHHLPPNPKIVEFHAGFGSMTGIYTAMSNDVTSYEKNKVVCKSLYKKWNAKAQVIRGNSYIHIKDLDFETEKEEDKFDLVCIDPYGVPTLMFPYVFGVIKRGGIMFITTNRFDRGFSGAKVKRSISWYENWGLNFGNKSHKKNWVTMFFNKLEKHAKIYGLKLEYIDKVDLSVNTIRIAIRVK